MKSRLTPKALIFGALMLLTASQSIAQGGGGRPGTTAEVVCGGIHRLTQSGDFLVGVTTLRNVSTETPIRINRIRAWNEDGTLLYDSRVSGFPFNPRFRSIINPHESSVFFSSDIVPEGTLSLQVRIRYQHRLGPDDDPVDAVGLFSVRDGSLFGAIQSQAPRNCIDVEPS